MGEAGWLEVWNAVIALVGRAPIFAQIMIWTGIALALVMCLEGLRVSFLPWRWLLPRMTRAYALAAPESNMPMVVMLSGGAPPVRMTPKEKPQRTVPKPARPPRNRKKVIARLRRTRPVWPKITRYPADKPLPLVEYNFSETIYEPMQDTPLR